MSNKLMTLVFENAELTGIERLVMLALADNSSEEGICWPSFQTIADRANTEKSYTIRLIRALEDAGYIRRMKRENTSNAYLINRQKLLDGKRPERKRQYPSLEDFAGATSTPAGVQPVPPLGATSTPAGVQPTTLKPPIEPPYNPQLNQPQQDGPGAEVFRVYEQEIGGATPLVADTLGDWLDNPKMRPEWIIEAIRQAATNNKRNLAYINGILKRFEAQQTTADTRPQKPAGKPAQSKQDKRANQLEYFKRMAEQPITGD